MAGISSQALQFGKYNKYRYNGGNEQQNKEFSDGSGLELYDANFRMYDGQIGRFHQLDPIADMMEGNSPYSFADNNPVLLNDPLGLAPDSIPQMGHITIVAPPLPKLPNIFDPSGLPDNVPGGSKPDVFAPQSPSGGSPAAPVAAAATGEAVVETVVISGSTLALGASLTLIGVLLPESTGKEPYMGPKAPPKSDPFFSPPKPPSSSNPNYEQYTLRATRDGAYPKRTWGLGFTGVTWLKKGDIWKIGTTSKGMKRYAQSFYENTGSGLRYLNEFTGTKEEVEFIETMKLINYAIQNGGEYPPGNSKLQ